MKGQKERELQSLTSRVYFGRRYPNLGKEASKIANDSCTMEHIETRLGFFGLKFAIGEREGLGR